MKLGRQRKDQKGRASKLTLFHENSEFSLASRDQCGAAWSWAGNHQQVLAIFCVKTITMVP